MRRTVVRDVLANGRMGEATVRADDAGGAILEPLLRRKGKVVSRAEIAARVGKTLDSRRTSSTCTSIRSARRSTARRGAHPHGPRRGILRWAPREQAPLEKSTHAWRTSSGGKSNRPSSSPDVSHELRTPLTDPSGRDRGRHRERAQRRRVPTGALEALVEVQHWSGSRRICLPRPGTAGRSRSPFARRPPALRRGARARVESAVAGEEPRARLSRRLPAPVEILADHRAG